MLVKHNRIFKVSCDRNIRVGVNVNDVMGNLWILDDLFFKLPTLHQYGYIHALKWNGTIDLPCAYSHPSIEECMTKQTEPIVIYSAFRGSLYDYDVCCIILCVWEICWRRNDTQKIMNEGERRIEMCLCNRQGRVRVVRQAKPTCFPFRLHDNFPDSIFRRGWMTII